MLKGENLLTVSFSTAHTDTVNKLFPDIFEVAKFNLSLIASISMLNKVNKEQLILCNSQINQH